LRPARRNATRRLVAGLALLIGAGAAAQPPVAPAESRVWVEGGRYVPLYGDGSEVSVEPFRLDAYPVTNALYLAFVRVETRWQRGRVPALLADAGYLRDWAGPLELGRGEAAPRPDAPVTQVSWFAARSYCAWRGGRLPTLDEWELVALADRGAKDGTADPGFHQRILDWYARPRERPLPPVGSTFENAYGIHDLHGLVWEWVEDFNSVFVTGESRADSSLDSQLYCAGAGAVAGDARNYAAFLRYALRSSLEASHAVGNLGFRCAADANEEAQAETGGEE
jgi:formylglycine-generating enzyme required for sulfatase activity